MHIQKVQNQKLSALKGLGVVALIFVAIYAVSIVTSLLTPLIGSLAASIAFWVAGILVALWTMRRFILSYSYGLGPNVLRVAYAYGRYERVMTDIYLNNILNAGTLEDMRTRYPSARVNRAIRPGCALSTLAVAVRDNGVPAIYLLQPDETIRTALEGSARKNRK